METNAVGGVTAVATIENLPDVLAARVDSLDPAKVRRVVVDDALVDTGAKLLSLPRRMIEQLGLVHMETRPARTSAGMIDTDIYQAVCLTIEGRRSTIDVAAVPDDCPVLIGYVPLELLDFVVDPVAQKLIPNPQDGDHQVLDLF